MSAHLSLKRVLIPSLLLVLTGCSSLAGVGGSASLSCPIPSGSTCKGIGQVFQSTPSSAKNNGGAPGVVSSTSQMISETGGAAQASLPLAPTLTTYVPSLHAARPVPTTGEPIRSPTRTLKIWIAPWEDEEGALRDHGYLYVVIDSGKWQLEHSRANIMRAFTPTRAPKQSTLNTSGSAEQNRGGTTGATAQNDAARQHNLPSLPQLLGLPQANDAQSSEDKK